MWKPWPRASLNTRNCWHISLWQTIFCNTNTSTDNAWLLIITLTCPVDRRVGLALCWHNPCPVRALQTASQRNQEWRWKTYIVNSLLSKYFGPSPLNRARAIAMERAALRKGKGGKGSSKKPSADPNKKRGSSGKGQGTPAWIPANTNRCWVLGRRGDKNPELSGDVRTPRTGIVSGTLYAHFISSATLELGGLWPGLELLQKYNMQNCIFLYTRRPSTSAS